MTAAFGIINEYRADCIHWYRPEAMGSADTMQSVPEAYFPSGEVYPSVQAGDRESIYFSCGKFTINMSFIAHFDSRVLININGTCSSRLKM